MNNAETLASRNRILLVTGTALALSLGAAACGGDSESAPTTVPGTELPGAVANPAPIEGAANVNDEILRLDNTACGGEEGFTSMEDLSYKFQFYTASAENLQLAQSNYDAIVTNPEMGMGSEAFGILLENGYKNTATINGFNAAQGENLTNVAGQDFDKMLALMVPVVLNGNRSYVNGDCRNNPNQVTLPSPDKPYINLEGGSSVEAVLLDGESYMQWAEAYNRFTEANGTDYRFDVMDIKVGDEVLYAVVIMANGCDNQIRIKPPVETPTTTTTTTPGTTTPETTVPGDTTTTTTPGETTTTTQPEQTTTTTTQPEQTTTTTTQPEQTTTTTTTVESTTTTTIEDKEDDGDLPGNPSVPADQDPGTPDEPGEGPAGQEPGEDGYLPDEEVPAAPTTTTTAPPTTVALPPATTGTQPTAPEAPATTAPGAGGAPDNSTMPTVPGA